MARDRPAGTWRIYREPAGRQARGLWHAGDSARGVRARDGARDPALQRGAEPAHRGLARGVVAARGLRGKLQIVSAAPGDARAALSVAAGVAAADGAAGRLGDTVRQPLRPSGAAELCR